MKKVFIILIGVLLANIGFLAPCSAAIDCSRIPESPLCKEIDNKTTNEESKTKIKEIIMKILPWIGGIAVLMIVYAGFVYTTSSGNEQKIKLAKDIIKNTIIGLILIILASVIIGFVIKLITS